MWAGVSLLWSVLQSKNHRGRAVDSGGLPLYMVDEVNNEVPRAFSVGFGEEGKHVFLGLK